MERLARFVPEVVGLDASETMLSRARARLADNPNVRFVQGDFRDFSLGRTFDLVVCEMNSMNYAAGAGDLGAVLRCVAQHLRLGGRFVFDTTTAAGMRQMSGLYLHAEGVAGRFVIRYKYDLSTRRQRAEVHTPSGIELHERTSIDPAEVATAALGSGLAVEEYFTGALLPGRWYTGTHCFFVLKRCES